MKTRSFKVEPSTADFSCTQCDAVFNTKKGLVAHGVHKHKNQRRRSPAVQQSPRRDASSRKKRQLEKHSDEESEDEPDNLQEEELEERVYNGGEDDEDEEEESPVKESNVESVKSEKTSGHSVISSPPTVKVIGAFCGLEQEEDDAEDEEDAEDATYQPTDDDDEDEDYEDVENYPCKFCESRIFLTSFGLERHTRMSHLPHLQEVKDDIKRLQDERSKKAEARKPIGPAIKTAETELRADALKRLNRVKEQHVKKRKYTKVVRLESAEKENKPDDEIDDESDSATQIARRQRNAVVSKASFTERRPTGRRRRSELATKAKYQSCDVCGILINTDHPRAMQSHTKAHQKNDELRQELLRLYGPGWVDNVTCRECNLVFKDEEKLEQHRRNVHIRRRHFLCRFCGDVFRNMRDLNLHKERRHNAFEGHRRHPDMLETVGYQRRISMVADSFEAAPNITLGADAESGGPTSRPSTVGDAGNAEEFSCRTMCEVCGMHMVRPSNLIRHMKLAHNRMSFTATVETKGMPPFKVDSQRGRFLWGCCDEIYDDRHTFIAHRRSAHGPQAYSGSPRECEHCGMMFRNNLLYINHLQTHRPRPCHVCRKAFTAASAVDSSLYRAHMQRHSEHGFHVNMPQITEDMAHKGFDPNSDVATRLKEVELAQEDDELDDRGCSGDEYSIFSESGVESECDDALSTCDDKDDAKLFTFCPVCGKKFDCVFRFGDHWSLHCAQPSINRTSLKTKSFSYKNARTLHRYKCSECRASFVKRSSLALHYLSCKLKRFGRRTRHRVKSVHLTDDQSSVTTKSTSSPLKKLGGSTKSPLSSEISSPRGKKRVAADDLSANNLKDASSTTSLTSEARKEMEDCVDMELETLAQSQEDGGGEKKQRKIAYLPEKAFVVSWNTAKTTPSSNPYVCLTCDRKLDDFLTLVSHVQTHIEMPLFEGLKEQEDETKVLDKSKLDEKKLEADKKLTKKTDDNLKINQTGEMTKNSEDKKDGGEAESPVRAFILGVQTTALLNEGRFSCPVCHKKFHAQSLLDEHSHLWHGARRQIRCDLCGKSFWTSYGLRKHLKRHDISQFYCNNCDKRFTSYETLTKHQTVHELTYSVYQCEDCVQSLYGLAQLKKHFAKNHPGINIVSCPVCARIHTDLIGLNEHFAAEHSATRSKCAICFKYFKTPMKVEEHVRKAHKARKLSRAVQCKKCGKWLSNAGKFAVHNWRHRVGKNFQCLLCDHMAESDEKVRQHLEKIHGVAWVDSRDLIIENRVQRPVAAC